MRIGVHGDQETAALCIIRHSAMKLLGSTLSTYIYETAGPQESVPALRRQEPHDHHAPNADMDQAVDALRAAVLVRRERCMAIIRRGPGWAKLREQVDLCVEPRSRPQIDGHGSRTEMVSSSRKHIWTKVPRYNPTGGRRGRKNCCRGRGSEQAIRRLLMRLAC